MNQKIYTIGYASKSLDDLIELIQVKGIATVVDVRSVPYSKRYSEFNKESLGNKCAKRNVRYIYLGHLLGARQTDQNLLFPDGKVDFNLLAKSENYSQGIDQIIHLNETVAPICLLCAEKDPYKCHRSILLGRVLANKGYKLEHYVSDNVSFSQNDIEDRLLKEYAPDYMQSTLFAPSISREEALEKVYKIRNKEISIVVY